MDVAQAEAWIVRSRPKRIGVIGGSRPTDEGEALAERVGELLAEAGAVLVCGGLTGVMAAACRGARRRGGLTVGILPGARADDANPDVMLPIPTDLGHARNVVIAHTAEAFIAIGGSYGTLSEIAHALNLGKPVVTLQSWQVHKILPEPSPLLHQAFTPEEAVALALEAARKHSGTLGGEWSQPPRRAA